jgi:DNA polymerase-3 subunit beta
MKFTIERQEFAKVLSVVSRITGSRSYGATNAGIIKLKAQNSSVVITASDIDMTIEATVPAMIEKNGISLVPGKALSDIVRVFPEEKINLVSDDDNLQLVGQRSIYDFQTYSGDDMPIRIWPSEKGVQIEVGLLRESIKQVIRAASNDEIRPVLTGVFFEELDNNLRLVATDSYRLALKDIVSVAPFEIGTKALVPARALNELDRVVSNSDESDSVWVYLSDDSARFEINNLVIWTQLINEAFPDYRSLIPTESELKLEVSKEAFLNALKRLRILVRESVSSVRLEPQSSILELSIISPDVGKAKESLDALVEGEEFPVAFNPTYLIEGIEAINEESVIIEIIKSKKPTLIYGKDNTTFKYLVMPVKLNEPQRT